MFEIMCQSKINYRQVIAEVNMQNHIHCLTAQENTEDTLCLYSPCHDSSFHC